MPPPTDQARWFTEEVDPHRAALRADVQRAFSTVRGVGDSGFSDHWMGGGGSALAACCARSGPPAFLE